MQRVRGPSMALIRPADTNMLIHFGVLSAIQRERLARDIIAMIMAQNLVTTLRTYILTISGRLIEGASPGICFEVKDEGRVVITIILSPSDGVVLNSKEGIPYKGADQVQQMIEEEVENYICS